MKIELTDQQEQAVRQGHPVEIVDSASKRAFVVVAREQYERIRSMLERDREGTGSRSPPPAVPPQAALGRQEEEPRRILLRDLPTPREVVEDAAQYCRKYGWWGKKRRQQMEEELKTQYYFGGQQIYLLSTPEGPVIIPIEGRYKDMPDLRLVLLRSEERSLACYTIPSRWRDSMSEILM